MSKAAAAPKEDADVSSAGPEDTQSAATLRSKHSSPTAGKLSSLEVAGFMHISKRAFPPVR